ncbi:response regulator [Pseudonocardia xinjiangensis]|uniref:response regulator n=1 Tax=Pseudonocardia xinjiangensis TaxID=75289 RepID=UPI003D8BBA1A
MTTPSRARIGVLVVDDHAVVRRGVAAYLEVLDDVSVVGEAVDGEDALSVLSDLSAHGRLPDVVLTDLQMPRLDGVAATREIGLRFPEVRVVVLTSFGESERVHAALKQGAAGYLLKDAGPDEVAAALHAAARGEVFLDVTVARRLTDELRTPRIGLGSLTAREREILVLVADGLSNREIADRLMIRERTARTHVSNLLGKLGLTSRTQAALVAVREGLVEAR